MSKEVESKKAGWRYARERRFWTGTAIGQKKEIGEEDKGEIARREGRNHWR